MNQEVVRVVTKGSTLLGGLSVSKTLLFNLFYGLLLVLSLPEVTGLLPEKAVPYAVAAVPVINIILRVFFPQTPITGTPAHKRVSEQTR